MEKLEEAKVESLTGPLAPIRNRAIGGARAAETSNSGATLPADNAAHPTQAMDLEKLEEAKEEKGPLDPIHKWVIGSAQPAETSNSGATIAAGNAAHPSQVLEARFTPCLKEIGFATAVEITTSSATRNVGNATHQRPQATKM